MSVEGGSIGGGVAAPVVVNEGPVSLSALENTMTIAKFEPVGEIVFKPSPPSVIEQAEAVAAKAWEAPQLNEADTTASLRASAKQSNSSVILSEIAAVAPEGGPRNDNFILPQIEPVILPRIEPAPALQASPVLEPVAKSRVSHQVAPAISPQPLLQEQEVEEEVLEKIEQAEPEDSLEEEEEIEKRLFLEDEKASAVRRFEIKQAIKLAKLSTIVGSVVARFLPGEHAGNRSQALHEKGPDGSYEETVEAIASSGEFSSPEQAEKRFDEIVAENKPVKNSKEGRSCG